MAFVPQAAAAHFSQEDFSQEAEWIKHLTQENKTLTQEKKTLEHKFTAVNQLVATLTQQCLGYSERIKQLSDENEESRAELSAAKTLLASLAQTSPDKYPDFSERIRELLDQLQHHTVPMLHLETSEQFAAYAAHMGTS